MGYRIKVYREGRDIIYTPQWRRNIFCKYKTFYELNTNTPLKYIKEQAAINLILNHYADQKNSHIKFNPKKPHEYSKL